jgi:outer membrane protein TolC
MKVNRSTHHLSGPTSALVAALALGPMVRPVAAEELKLDLHSAILMAVEQNRDLQVESYGPPIRRAIQLQASGEFDPTLSAEYRRREETDRTGVVPSIVQGDTASAEVGGLLPWGMTYSMGLASSLDRGNATGFSGDFDSGFRFALRQPLAQGFGTDVTLARLRIARRDVTISEWSLRATLLDVVTRVISTYNDLYSAARALDVAKRSLSLAQQLVDDNSRRLEIGVMSPLDVTEARAEAAKRKEAVIIAGRLVRDNENFLKRLVSDEIDRFLAIQVRIAPPPNAVTAPIDVGKSIADALVWRPDYRQGLIDLEKRKITVVVEKDRVLPRIDLEASLDLMGFDPDVAQSFGRSLDDERTSWSVGAVFQLPVPNRTGHGRALAAKLDAARALMDLKRLEQDIVVRVDNAAGKIATAKERIVSTSEARALAEEALDSGQERLKVGATTTFVVLQLQEDLAEAEIAELRARLDYNKAVAEFDRETGMTLQQNGVAFVPN